jgi:hypothetical protein
VNGSSREPHRDVVFAHPFRHRAHPAVLAGQQGDDAVCLAQLVGAQHDRLVAVERHLVHSAPRAGAGAPQDRPGAYARGSGSAGGSAGCSVDPAPGNLGRRITDTLATLGGGPGRRIGVRTYAPVAASRCRGNHTPRKVGGGGRFTPVPRRGRALGWTVHYDAPGHRHGRLTERGSTAGRRLPAGCSARQDELGCPCGGRSSWGRPRSRRPLACRRVSGRRTGRPGAIRAVGACTPRDTEGPPAPERHADPPRRRAGPGIGRFWRRRLHAARSAGSRDEIGSALDVGKQTRADRGAGRLL